MAGKEKHASLKNIALPEQETQQTEHEKVLLQVP